MLARLSKDLLPSLPPSLATSVTTRVAIGGLTLLVLGAGGTGVTLAAGKSPVPTPNTPATTAQDAHKDETAGSERDDASEGARPTDTHGYCVSQVAKTETTGDVNHGSLVSAAAHACGKQAKAADKAAKAASKASRATGRAAERAAEKAAERAAEAATRADEASGDSADDEADESSPEDKAAKRQDGKRANA